MVVKVIPGKIRAGEVPIKYGSMYYPPQLFQGKCWSVKTCMTRHKEGERCKQEADSVTFLTARQTETEKLPETKKSQLEIQEEGG